MRMTWTPTTIAANFDHNAVAARCPAGWADRGAALLSTTGVGKLTYAGHTVDVTIAQSHCTLPRPPQPPEELFARKVTPLDIEAGQMTIHSSSGDLSLYYRAPGVLKGDLTLVGYNMHTFNGPYAVTGGTGAFTGASGDGHLAGYAGGQGGPAGLTGAGTLFGSLRLAG
jgi:hypothetical protein